MLASLVPLPPVSLNPCLSENNPSFPLLLVFVLNDVKIQIMTLSSGFGLDAMPEEELFHFTSSSDSYQLLLQT